MQDLLSGVLVGILGSALLLLLISRYGGTERILLAGAYVGHVLAAFAQVLIQRNVYGSGDIFGYAGRGEELAAALRLDFQGISVELLKLLFHQEAHLPIYIQGAGSSTGSMAAIAGFSTFLTGGGVYAGCVLIGVLSFYGTMCLYQVFRDSFPVQLRTRLLVANMLMPSVVYWSSGLLKESVAMAGLGPLTLGSHWLLNGKHLSGALLTLLGALLVGLVKPYILFAFVLAAGGWVYATSAVRAGRPLLSLRAGLIALALAIGGLILLGNIFPKYALETIAEQAAYRQEVGQRARGDSTYEIGDYTQTSLAGQLVYAPFALVTALFRPFFFEGAKAQQIANALETTAILAFTIAVAWRVRVQTLWRVIASKPLMLFCTIFIGVFGVAVGLSTTNLGTLSRYRMPLVPLFASLLVVWWEARRASGAQLTGTARSLPPPPGQRRLRPGYASPRS